MKTRVGAFLLVGLLLAGQLGPGSAVADDDEPRFRGFGVVWSRDDAKSTLEIDGRSYRVTPSTVFHDRDGKPIEFGAFPIFDVHAGIVALEDATKADFVARRDSSGPVLESVRLTDRLPN